MATSDPPVPSDSSRALGPDAYFRDKLAQGILEFQTCSDCGGQIFYPRQVCPLCGSTHLTWVRSSGKGTVYSTSVVRRRPERGGNYNISIIEMDGGARLMSQVTGIEPTAVKIGMPVVARIDEIDEKPVVMFDPVEKGEA